MVGGLTGLSDGALVERHLVGQEGFDVLYRRYQSRLAGFCMRFTRDRSTAEDLAQDTMLRALTHLDQFDTDRSLWPWLKVMAGRVAVDRARHQRGAEEPLGDADFAASQGNEFGTCEDRELLAQAMGGVPHRQRLALGLRYVHDWESSDGAELLGVRRSAFLQLVHRGRKSLRDEYERVTRDGAERLGVLAPVVAWWRRLRAAVGRAQVSAGETLTSQWSRFDPMSAMSAVMGTTAATLSLTTALVVLGGGGHPGGPASPVAAGAGSSPPPVYMPAASTIASWTEVPTPVAEGLTSGGASRPGAVTTDPVPVATTPSPAVPSTPPAPSSPVSVASGGGTAVQGQAGPAQASTGQPFTPEQRDDHTHYDLVPIDTSVDAPAAGETDAPIEEDPTLDWDLLGMNCFSPEAEESLTMSLACSTAATINDTASSLGVSSP